MIEKIRLLFFIVNELTCAIIKQINKIEFVKKSAGAEKRNREIGSFFVMVTRKMESDRKENIYLMKLNTFIIANNSEIP